MADSPATDGPSTTSGRPVAVHSLIYVGGTALQGLGVLLIIPFATRVLGAAEFGRVATGLVIVQMVGTIAAAGLPQVILREHHRGPEGPRVARALAGAMVLLALGLGVFGALGLAVAASAGIGSLSSSIPVVVSAASLTIVVSGQTLMRARMQPVPFLVLAVGSTVLAQLGGLLAVRADPTAEAYLTAYAGVIGGVALLAILMGKPLFPTHEPARVRQGLRLAAPLLPQAAAMLALLMGDVVLTTLLLGDAAAGTYQVSLQLGNIAFVLSTALFNAWGPLVFSHPLERRWSFTADTGAILTSIVGAGGVGVALLSPWLVAVMTKADFDQMAMVHALGWLSSVGVLYMVYQGSSLAVLDAERTSRLAWAALAALAVMVAVSLVAAPLLGIVGIAVAKVVGYAGLAAGTTWFAARHSPFRWPGLVGVTVALALGLGVCAGGLLPVEGPGVWVRLGLASMVALVAAVATPRALRSLRG